MKKEYIQTKIVEKPITHVKLSAKRFCAQKQLHQY